jgi:hypothetical protein
VRKGNLREKREGCKPSKVNSFEYFDHTTSLLFGVFKDKDFIYVGHTDKGLNRGEAKEQLRRS